MADKGASSFDLIVIGGGISGLGVAREAGRRGLRCALFEKGRCCTAASSSSLRIIHGGLRYLQHLNFRRTLESLREQDDLLRRHPGLVAPLWCLMPLNRFGLKSAGPLWCALQAYRLAAFAAGAEKRERAELLPTSAAREKAILLREHPMHGALLWRDALLCSSSHFAEAVKKEMLDAGVALFEERPVTELRPRAGGYTVKAGGESFDARTVVNASGAWLQRIDGPQLFPKLRWCKAFNLIIARRAVGDLAEGAAGASGRVYFAVPRDEGTAVGTFYRMYEGDPDEAAVSAAELEGAVREVNAALPALMLRADEVAGVESAVLPARRDSADGPVLYGAERLRGRDGYVQVLSTKFTTFQSQARAVMRRVERALEARGR